MRATISETKVIPAVLFDRWFLFAALALLFLGLIMVASASIGISERGYGTPFHYIIRQICYVGLGGFCSFIILRIHSDYWQRYGGYLMLLTLLLLVIVLIPGLGREINGSRRWLGIGPLGFQISELAKFTVIIYLAGYLVRRGDEVRSQVVGFLKPMLLLGIVSCLLLLEPDFGATAVMMMTALLVLFIAGVPLRHYLALICVVGAGMGGLAVSSPYRLARLTSFLNPWVQQYASGYQLTQSLIAFGRGGWLGVGLGNSVQKLFYLPEAHTDFLFAVLAEELGLIGEAVVVGLFALLITRIFMIARRAHRLGKDFAAYLGYGFGIWIGLQVFINIGVNSGMLPTKGLTLPLMSYGGSSLLVMLMALAMILRIDYECRLEER